MSERARELTWVFRPASERAAEIRAFDGMPVHASGPAGPDGSKSVVLRDGSRVWARRGELVAESVGR